MRSSRYNRVMKEMADNAKAAQFNLLRKLEDKLSNETCPHAHKNLLVSIDTIAAVLFRQYGYRGECYYAANYDERI